MKIRLLRYTTICYRTMLVFAIILGCFAYYEVVHRPVGAALKTVPVSVTPEVGTINRATLKQFIQRTNQKVYDRMATEIIDGAIRYGHQYHISPVLVLAVMEAESQFNVNAESKTDARGLMQVQFNVWGKDLVKKGIVTTKAELHDPRKNIESGCYILRIYLDETHDLEKALNNYLGADSAKYRAEVDRQVGSILMIGISVEINASYGPDRTENLIYGYRPHTL